MNTQTQLIIPDVAPRTYTGASHPDTSRAAAASVEVHLGAMSQKVLDYIKSCGEDGATDEEIAIGADMRLNSTGARRFGLNEEGLIMDTGLTRANTSGRQARVWVAVVTKGDE